jgi:RHS repeat-associated protein
VTTTAPDGSYTVSAYSYGRLVSITHHDSTGAQIGGTSYGYDAQGRRNTITDARNGTTTIGFNNADLVATNTTPNPGGASPEITTTTYNNMMRPVTVTQPDGTTVSSVYLLTGELGLQYGSRTYPVGYSYDYAGRMQTMTNWSCFSTLAGARVTTWNYDPYRGWLTSKAYADGQGPSYSYTPAGRLVSRTWARGVTTAYAYDSAGGLTNIVYSDSTPGVTNSYDCLGRLSSVACGEMTDTLTYNYANQLLSESFTGGPLDGLSVTNGYDQYLRRATLAALNQFSPLSTISYTYDNASRLSSVSDGNNNSATYSYLANSPLAGQILFQQGSTTRMTTTKTYDYLNRLTQISSAPSAGYTLPLAFNYNYNPANQRTKDTLADGSYWVYGYDSLGQVTNGCKYFADGTPVGGQQFDYTFDTIGNRTQTQSGGDQTGANLRVANYSANILNQITSRDVPAYVDVMGASILTNAVTVNGQTAYRKQEYFRQQLPANNSAAALWTNIIVSGGQSVTGNVYVAREPEVFRYDADGNLTNDGRWAYTWDAENRLIGMTVNTNVGPQYQITFAYDSKCRRIQKIVATNNGTIYVPQSTNNFLYDGWNLVTETKPDDSLIRSYVWGTDVSGSQKGASGVGGLLEVSYYGSYITNCFPASDGNGNVAALVNAANGTVAAIYEYGPFGEVIRATGTMAKVNPFRFSTKYQDDETDFLYYGFRYYNPCTGRWINRDPMEERGWLALYEMCRNNPLKYVDTDGRDIMDTIEDILKEIGVEWVKWLFANRETIVHVLNVDCPAGSKSQLVSDAKTTKSRKLDVTISVGLFSYSSGWGDVVYFTRKEKQYKCCACQSFFTSDTLKWQHQDDPPVDTEVDSPLNINIQLPSPDVSVNIHATDTTTTKRRTRDCTVEVDPLSTYETWERTQGGGLL